MTLRRFSKHATTPALLAITSVLSFTALSPTTAVAQQAAGGFCTSTPVQMLSAIEGQWTFKQGAGVGIGVVIPFPLPSHPPQSVRIDVDETRGFATLRHAGQQMAILPIAPGDVEAATRFETERFLDEADAEGLIDTSGGCQWVSLPLMLGSTSYALDEANLVDDDAYVAVVRVMIPAKKDDEYIDERIFVFCNGFYAGEARREGWLNSGAVELPRSPVHVDGGGAVRPRHARECKDAKIKAPKPGEMVMNLLVKFNGPDRGTGILLFAGEMDGYRFAARAPVTLTR